MWWKPFNRVEEQSGISELWMSNVRGRDAFYWINRYEVDGMNFAWQQTYHMIGHICNYHVWLYQNNGAKKKNKFVGQLHQVSLAVMWVTVAIVVGNIKNCIKWNGWSNEDIMHMHHWVFFIFKGNQNISEHEMIYYWFVIVHLNNEQCYREEYILKIQWDSLMSWKGRVFHVFLVERCELQ